MGAVALPVLLICYLAFGGRGWLLSLIELAVVGLMWLTDRRLSPKIDHYLEGAGGERKVGRILDELENDGWFALHDVSLDRGNIDHILIGQGGIFTIETKSRKLPIRADQIHEDSLKQAYAEAKAVERITGYKVQPLLVFSDAWLIGKVPARRRGVVILPARLLDGFISRKSPVVTRDRAIRFHKQLALALSG